MPGGLFRPYTCFMRESERIFLETLRAGVGSNVDKTTWGVVEKQVAESGVRGLTGSARMMVESLVAKHGSHNQASHNPHAGGGGGGSSSGGSKGGGNKGGGGDVIDGLPPKVPYPGRKQGETIRREVKWERDPSDKNKGHLAITDTLPDGSTKKYRVSSDDLNNDGQNLVFRNSLNGVRLTGGPKRGEFKDTGLMRRTLLEDAWKEGVAAQQRVDSGPGNRTDYSAWRGRTMPVDPTRSR